MPDYQTPAGFYDQPFTWVWNLPPTLQGPDALNQFIYIQSGWGDFLLRRVVGLASVLSSNAPNLGRYHIRDRRNLFVSAEPLYMPFVLGVDDLMFVPEVSYPERSKIGFDLYDIATLGTACLPLAGLTDGGGLQQVWYQIVNVNVPYLTLDVQDPRPAVAPFSITFDGTNIVAVAASPDGISITTTVAQLRAAALLIPSLAAVCAITDLNSDDTTHITPTTAGPQPFAFIEIQNCVAGQVAFQGVRRQPGHLPNLGTVKKIRPKSFTYVATAEINQTGTLPGYVPIRVRQTIDDYDFELEQLIITYAPTGDFSILSAAALVLFDAAHNQVCNLPVVDRYWNGVPLSGFYLNGAVEPGLVYPKDSQIGLDLYSILTTTDGFPITATVHFVGKQRIPC